jgi:hypothetical protein
MRRRLSRTRALVAASFAALYAGGLVACQSDAVVIGIEGDGGPTAPLSTPTPHPPPNLDQDAGPRGLDPSSIDDASVVPCLPDGGCPGSGVCWYLLDAGCGALGECIEKAPAPPPPAPPPVGGLIVRGTYGYSTTPPTCDDASAPDDAAANDADADATRD